MTPYQKLVNREGDEHPEDEVKDARIAEFALQSPLGHRKVRQEKCGELRFGEVDGNGVVVGFGAAVLMMQWPHGRNDDAN
jgi:hypothetical protein